jgi:hypothetical protein
MTNNTAPEARRAERERDLEATREALREALTGHSISDQDSEIVLLEMELEAEQRRLDDMMDADPMRTIWFELDKDD